MTDLQIVSLNCRGLGDFRKRKHICQILNSSNVDVCFLQETHVYNNIVADNFFLKIWVGNVIGHLERHGRKGWVFG